MAVIEDADPELRNLALAVPAETLALLSREELYSRVRFAAELEAKARFESAGRQRKAKADAKKILTAMPIEMFTDKAQRLRDEYDSAVLRGDDPAQRLFRHALLRLDKENPYPDSEWLALLHIQYRLAEAADRERKAGPFMRRKSRQ